MVVKVSYCWSGNEHYSYRLELPCGRRESVRWNGYWSRAVAKEALDRLSSLYGLDRRKIRFRHV
jgi:hypothetical protein